MSRFGLHIRQQLVTPVGPDHFQAVYAPGGTKPEMRPVIHRGRVTPVRRVVEVLLLSAGREDQSRSDPRGQLMRRFSLQPDLQVVMHVVVGPTPDILVDECQAR